LGSSVHLPGGGAVIVREEVVGEFGRSPNGEEENSKATPKPKSALAPDDSGGSPPSIGSIDQKTPVISPDLGREPKTGDGADADDSKQNHDFLWWCNHVMGIKMPHVEIRSFTYPDYLSERAVWNDYHAQMATARAIQSVLGASNDRGHPHLAGSRIGRHPPNITGGDHNFHPLECHDFRSDYY